MSKKAGIYLRVSTAGQVDDGYGLDTQLAHCTTFAEREGWEVTKVYTDPGVSGRLAERPEMQEAIQDATAGMYSILLMGNRKRLSRDQETAQILKRELTDAGAELQYADDINVDIDAPMAGVIDSLGHALAEEEVKDMVRRTLPARREAVKQGSTAITHRPFGYNLILARKEAGQDKQGQRLEINEPEARIVRQIFKWAAIDVLGVEIARRLNAKGVRTTTGREWSPRNVLNHLRRELYIGKWYFGKEVTVDGRGKPNLGKKGGREVAAPKSDWIETEVPAIVDQESWDQVAAKLGVRKRHRKGFRADALMRQRISCRECGALYHTKTQPAGKKYNRVKDYTHYIHPTDEECPNRSHFNIDKIDPLVKQWIMDWFVDPEPDWSQFTVKAGKDSAELVATLDGLQAQAAELDQERPQLIKLHAKGTITEADLTEQLERIAGERELLDADIGKLSSSINKDITLEWPEEMQAEQAWQELKNAAEQGDTEYFGFAEMAGYMELYGIELETTVDGEVYLAFDGSEDIYPIWAGFVQRGARV